MAASDSQLKAYLRQHQLVPSNALTQAETEAAVSHKNLADILLARRLLTPQQLSQIEQTSTSAPNQETPSIEKSVRIILEYAVRSRANAIHLEPRGDRSQVRYRVDDVLTDNMSLPLHLHAAAISYLKQLAGLNPAETRVPQSGQFSQPFDNAPVIFQLSILPTMAGENAVVKVIDETSSPTDLSQLGMNKDDIERVNEVLARRQGLVLVTSPVGPDASEVLYSLLRSFDPAQNNVTTIENPVVSALPGVNQTEIDPLHGLNFATAISAALRQDSNVLMVSDIVDKISAELVADGALSGRQVLAGLHAADTVAALVRINDMNVAPFLIASTVRLLMATRRVRRLCPDCRRRYIPSGDELSQIKAKLGELPKTNQRVGMIKSVPQTGFAPTSNEIHLKKVIPAPSRLELERTSILDRIAHDPNIIYRSLSQAEQATTASPSQPQTAQPTPTGNEVAFYQPVGCERCGRTGYRGQINLFEVLLVNDSLSQAIAAGKTADELRELALKNGFAPLARDGLNKAAHGLTTIAEVLRVL